MSRRLWKAYVRKHTGTIILTFVLLVISSAATSAQPLLIQQAFDKIFKAHDTTALVVVPFLIVLVFIVQAVTLFLSNHLMGKVSNSMIADMRKSMFRHVIDNEVEFYSKNDSGSLLSRIISEIIHIAAAVTNFFNAWFRQLITSIGLLAVMIYQSPQLTVISLIAFIFAAIPLRRITVRLKKLTRQLNDENANLNSRLIESLAGVRTVKAFRKEECEIDKMSGYVHQIERLSNKAGMFSVIVAPLLQIIGGISIAFVIWFGGHELLAGRMTEGNLVAFIASLMMFSRPVRSLSNAGSIMIKGYIAADRFFEIIDAKPKFISRAHGATLNITKAEIVFDHVSFSYPGGEVQAMQDVSIRCAAGKKTALVGHSGSGKSTIFNLIMKFYEPTAGRILIDGQDLAEVSINSARDNLAIVSQDIFIFDESVLNNIGYGREGASKEDIVAASKAARCHDFIMKLPKGYETMLGFSGESLSGGEKQRIAIARAFLRNAPILLMDEATSALDPKTESALQESLDELTRNRTTIIIAHRLSTVINADHMVLMHEGRVAASGTHESLLAESALYRNHFGI
ncbi:MAG: ABC transporter ATP-binding protein [Alphaproteobacteria bacterium]|nr:ABC transporter ATP-binding protein [Alphaproteobacteria bacterium]